MPEGEKDYIAEHFQGQRDEVTRRIHARFNWVFFFIIALGIVNFTVKEFLHIEALLLLLLAAWVTRLFTIMQTNMDNLRSEIRYRSAATDQKIVDVHTSVAYIYAEKMGLLDSEGDFSPLVFLWNAKRTGRP